MATIMAAANDARRRQTRSSSSLVSSSAPTTPSPNGTASDAKSATTTTNNTSRRSPRMRTPTTAAASSSPSNHNNNNNNNNKRKTAPQQPKRLKKNNNHKTNPNDPKQHVQFHIPTTQSAMDSDSAAAHRQQQLGDDTNGMCLLYPPSPEPPAVALVRQLDALLQRKVVQTELVRCVWKEYHAQADKNESDYCESIRMIQGGRLEIFLHSRGKSSRAFDQVLGKRLKHNHTTTNHHDNNTTNHHNNQSSAKEIILEYCCDQASRDPRLHRGYALDTFSLLVNFEAVPAQAPHIDMVQPNFQFGLVCTTHAPSTMFVPNPDQLGHAQTVEQLQDLWHTNAAFGDDKFPDGVPLGIVNALQRDAGATQLLQYFGDTLLPEATLQQHLQAPSDLPVGTLVSLPGSIVHCGPAAAGHRAIVFFSGTPHNNNDQQPSVVDAYLPDNQYSGVTLTAHLASILWRKDGITYKEREYLLRKVRQYVHGCSRSSSDVFSQLSEGPMKEFIETIYLDEYQTDRAACDALIYETTKRMDMVVPEDPFSKTDLEMDVDSMTLISHETGLYTLWDEPGYQEEIQVALYHRPSDDKYILRFLYHGDEKQNPDEYMGHRPHEKLSFQWSGKRTKHAKFDGTNGTLWDEDGEIVIYKGRRHPQKKSKAPMPKKKRRTMK